MSPRASICLFIAVGMTACGGGSDNPKVSGTYAGNWVSSCYVEGDTVYRYRDSVSLKSAGSNSLTYTGSLAMYSNADCSGVPDDIAEYMGVVELAGAKTIESMPVDKVNVTPTEQEPSKTLFVLQAGDLHVGRKDAPVDADGYPTTVQTAYRLVRQN